MKLRRSGSALATLLLALTLGSCAGGEEGGPLAPSTPAETSRSLAAAGGNWCGFYYDHEIFALVWLYCNDPIWVGLEPPFDPIQPIPPPIPPEGSYGGGGGGTVGVPGEIWSYIDQPDTEVIPLAVCLASFYNWGVLSLVTKNEMRQLVHEIKNYVIWKYVEKPRNEQDPDKADCNKDGERDEVWDTIMCELDAQAAIRDAANQLAWAMRVESAGLAATLATCAPFLGFL